MRIFKFGGGVLNSAESIKKMAEIIKETRYNKLVVVVSALGKTTNKLENIADKAWQNSSESLMLLKNLKKDFDKILTLLYPVHNVAAEGHIESLFLELSYKLKKTGVDSFDYFYDQVVVYGEIISSRLISDYLMWAGLENKWLDARKNISTSGAHRKAEIIDELCLEKLGLSVKLDMSGKLYITQGFIGADENGITTTLGREGSDYTAGFLAAALNASEIIIWKDVDGVFNADPKKFPSAVKLDHMSYEQASELTMLGAKILHFRTIEPLAQADIELKISNFHSPGSKGTLITNAGETQNELPFIIDQEGYAYYTIHKNISEPFNAEEKKQLSRLFYKYELDKVFLEIKDDEVIACSKYDKYATDKFINELGSEFMMMKTIDLKLLTIKNFNDDMVADLLKDKGVFYKYRKQDVMHVLYV